MLGALLEKDITTPEYYPLTVNALQNACNQKSSREPVVGYNEDTVVQALGLLKDKGLVLRVSGAGHRVEKWAHRMSEVLNLGRREEALLCVLMLRGAQTIGELRNRTERMHSFVDLEEVESVLESLALREPHPLTARVPRGRWVHLLGDPAHLAALAEEETTETRPPLEHRVSELERQLAELRMQFDSFRKQLE